MTDKPNGKRGALKTYKAYLFRDKDPSIDVLRTLVEQHYGERIKGRMLKDIEEIGGPTAGCMAGWFFRDTKRPQNATLEAAGRALGYERRWVRQRANRPVK